MTAAHGQLTGAAVLVAAGDGRRLGSDVPKAFVTVAGRTLLEHAAGRFAGVPGIAQLVVAAPPALVESALELVPGATVVPGGRTRQQSVERALAALSAEVDAVLVHDVARAFVPPEVITRVLAALQGGAVAVVPTVAVTDTIRRAGEQPDELGELVDRSVLLAMQTPQGFRRDVLVEAHARAAASATAVTDDAALVEALGLPVVSVPGDERSFKITVPLDLALAEAMAATSLA